MMDKLKYCVRASLVALGLLAGSSVWANRPSLIITPVLVVIDWENIRKKSDFHDPDIVRRINALKAQGKKIEETYRVYPGNESAMPLIAKWGTSECVGKAGEIYTPDDDVNTRAENFRHKLEVGDAMASQTLNSDFSLLKGRSINASIDKNSYFKSTGQISATVSADVCAEKSNIVLIRKGSRLLGRHHLVTVQGQTRAYVVWTHINSLTPP